MWFPRASNATDVDALAAEPGVTVSLTADPDTVAASDVVVLPGSRATVDDLRWLRERARRSSQSGCGNHRRQRQRADNSLETEH